jgi:AraC-type DNA-binding domain-containing proteins
MVNSILIASGFTLMTVVIVVLTVLLLRKRMPRPPAPQPPHMLTSGYAITPKQQQLLRDDSPTDEDEELKERLLFLFEGEKLYLRPDIRITEVAERLLTNKTHLSKVIRIKTGKNFCQLVHSYRIREAMRLFSGNPNLSIVQLGQLVGFNSLTTFTTAFGRNTGYTPAEWCKNYRRSAIKKS